MTIPESEWWSAPSGTSAPAAAAAPPPWRRRNRRLLVVLIVVVALAVAVGSLALVRRVLNPPSAFPNYYATAVFTISPDPTAQQVRDAAATLEEDVAHLGASSVQSAIRGSRIEIAVLRDEVDALITAQDARLNPRLSLVVMDHGTGPVREEQPFGKECFDSATGYFFCDAQRQTAGVPGQSFLDGSDIADATAAADSQTGTWSVTVKFTARGKLRYNWAIDVQTRTGLVAYAIQLDGQSTWSLTPLETPYALKPDGRIPNLNEVDAQRIAAVLRLCRSQVEIRGQLKA